MAGPMSMTAVRDAARRHAPDFYLSALLAPRASRDDLTLIAALVGEIFRIPTQVSDPMLGEIRLQWWRDALRAAASGARSGHPVADALGGLLERGSVEVGLLLAIPDAGDAGAEATAAFAAAAHVLGLGGGADVAHVVASAGAAYGGARELALQAAHGALGGPEKRAEVRRALEAARKALRHAPAATVAAIRPAALVEPYLRVSELDVESARHELGPLWPMRRITRLWVSRATGRI